MSSAESLKYWAEGFWTWALHMVQRSCLSSDIPSTASQGSTTERHLRTPKSFPLSLSMALPYFLHCTCYLLNFFCSNTFWCLLLPTKMSGMKFAGRNIDNLRYADETTLMAESEEELKSLLMKVKDIRLFYTSVSLLLSRTQGYCYHLSKFHIYALVYCIGVFLSGLLHSV